MIRILDDRVVNRIAAGEVVERPASVLKELLENSLDAGASSVRIALRSGGRSLVQVVDDGCGMSRNDATLCLERHATSKIRAFEDLEEVRTLGFRGEALPSIASVSRFELVTRPPGTDVATRVSVDGGRILSVDEAGGPEGTRISVRSLFFNVPARRKFMRTVPTELGHCIEAVVREALPRPDLDVEVTHDGKGALRAPKSPDRARRAASLLGSHGRALVPADFEAGELTVEALVSPVGVHRGSARGSSYLYVNGRFVRDPVLRRAVTDAYRGIVPKGRHPVVVLNLQIPHAHVDVNVHPAKTEVRFRSARQVAQAVSTGLRRALEHHGIQRPVPDRRPPQILQPPEPSRQVALPRATERPAPPPEDAVPVVEDGAPRVFASQLRPAALPDLPSPAPEPTVVRPPAAPAPAHTAPATPPARPRAGLLPVDRFEDLRVVGQLNRTYVLCEGAGELVIIDQHAAHERVTLHRLQQTAKERLSGGQRLLSPPIVELAAGRAEALAAHTEHLLPYGLEVTPMGDRAFAIKQLPTPLSGADPVQLIADIADDLTEGGRGRPIEAILERVLATMACHTSIRAGQRLSAYEMRELLRALDRVDFSVCAHGRPVCIRVGTPELERRFHRA